MTDFMIRGPHPDDVPFIYATWLNSYRYDSDLGKSCRNETFFVQYSTIIDAILTRDEINILIACDPENTNVILAYLVFEPGMIHYAFTKQAFRQLGIATLLFNKAFPNFDTQSEIFYSHKTKALKDVLRYKLNLVYNPFNLFKGVKDGPDISRKESAQNAHGNRLRSDWEQDESSC